MRTRQRRTRSSTCIAVHHRSLSDSPAAQHQSQQTARPSKPWLTYDTMYAGAFGDTWDLSLPDIFGVWQGTWKKAGSEMVDS